MACAIAVKSTNHYPFQSNSPRSHWNSIHRPFNRSPNSHPLPIPREDNLYSRAKRCEYQFHDLDKAEALYKDCLIEGIRPESALKDLASLLHQRGKTEEACQLLTSYQDKIQDADGKLANLLKNLQEKIDNKQPRYLKMKKLPTSETPKKPETSNPSNGTATVAEAETPAVTEAGIRGMFTHPERLMKVEIFGDETLLEVMSISAAKKTVTCFQKHHEYSLAILDVDESKELKIKAELLLGKSLLQDFLDPVED